MIKLHHANICTSQFEAAIAFYSEVLGLTAGPAATRPSSDNHIWMSDSEALPCIHLQRGNDSAYPVAINHLAFHCHDPEAWRRKLLSLNVPYAEKEFYQADILQFNLKDPSGIGLELLFTPRRDSAL